MSASIEESLLVLICVRDRKRLIDICAAIGKSMGIVQRHIAILEKAGYVKRVIPENKTGRKSQNRGRILTTEGKAFLRSYGHTVEAE